MKYANHRLLEICPVNDEMCKSPIVGNIPYKGCDIQTTDCSFYIVNDEIYKSPIVENIPYKGCNMQTTDCSFYIVNDRYATTDR